MTTRNLQDNWKRTQYILNTHLDTDTDPPTLVFGIIKKVPGVGYGDEELSDYPYAQYSYDVDGNVEYIGGNLDTAASDDDTDWRVTKFTYTSGNIVKKEVKTGSWNGRVALF